MQTQLVSVPSLTSTVFQRCRSLCVGVLVAGLSAIAGLPAIAHATPPPNTSTLPDGVYLYGQTPEPEQVGKGYFVFEVNKGNVVGALYMPRSSFDCAAGTFQRDQLALKVVNSYDRTANPFEIALEKTANVATAGNPAVQEVSLQGFHRLSSLSDNDRRILNVCKTDFQQAKH